jgi:hypothetical protein
MDMCRYHGGSCRNREKYNDCPDGFYVKGLCHRKCHKTQCCISSKYDHTILDFSIAFIASMFNLQIVMFFLITNFLLSKIHFYFQTILIGSNPHNIATISDTCTRHMLVAYFVIIWAEQIISEYNVYILSVQNVKKFLFY